MLMGLLEQLPIFNPRSDVFTCSSMRDDINLLSCISNAAMYSSTHLNASQIRKTFEAN